MNRRLFPVACILLAAPACTHDDQGRDRLVTDDRGNKDDNDTEDLRDGLLQSFYVGATKDTLNQPVCDQLTGPWQEGENLTVADTWLRMRYAQGSTPCEDIEYGEIWGAHFEGLIKVTNDDGDDKDKFSTDLLADVNDGIRVVITDKKGKSVCDLDFWQDVPEYDNYHSTDANDIVDVCSKKLKEKELYGISIDFYHRPDANVSHSVFNRAWMDLSFRNLISNSAKVDFYHHPEDAPPLEGLEVEYFVDGDEDGSFETEVCTTAAASDDALTYQERAIRLSYGNGGTPCGDIEFGHRWSMRMEGTMTIDVDDAEVDDIPVDLWADVNDGLRVSIREEDGGPTICEFDFWEDVPEFDNYHSTDANGIEDVCDEPLEAGTPYHLSVEFYHQPDTSKSPNSLFNRAYMKLGFSGLSSYSGRIDFTH